VERPDAGVIFNAVGNWPIETVASTTQDVVYIEVWPPDDSYNDLQRLIRDARRLSGGKQVILAAYLMPFADADTATLPQAEAAALLATATIAASGGSHLLLGERDGILCDPYYPKYAKLRPEFAAQMRTYYDFLLRYEELLIAPELEGWDQRVDARLALGDARLSTLAEAGAVWVMTTRKPGYRIVHLINLTNQRDIAWNALRTPPEPLHNVELSIHGIPPVRQALLLTPDAHLGRPQPLTPMQHGDQLQLRVLHLPVWAIVVCTLQQGYL
jgi:dextranase